MEDWGRGTFWSMEGLLMEDGLEVRSKLMESKARRKSPNPCEHGSSVSALKFGRWIGLWGARQVWIGKRRSSKVDWSWGTFG